MREPTWCHSGRDFSQSRCLRRPYRDEAPDVARLEGLLGASGEQCTEGDTKCIGRFEHTCDANGNWVKDSPATQCGGSGVIEPGWRVEIER